MEVKRAKLLFYIRKKLEISLNKCKEVLFVYKFIFNSVGNEKY